MHTVTRRSSLVILLGLLAGCSAEMLGDLPDAGDGEIDAPISETPAARPRADARVFADAPMGTPDAQMGAPDAPAQGTPDARIVDARPVDAGGTTNPMTCLAGDDTTPIEYSTIFRQESFAGAGDDYVFNSSQCGDMPDSAERIYGFELAMPTEVYVETRCEGSSGWDCELVLTRDGCGDPDVVLCETSIGDEAVSRTLQPGGYALFVEGDNPEDPAVYDLMVNLHHTAGQLVCDSTTLNVIDPANCEDPVLDSPHYHVVVDGATSPADLDDFYMQDIDGCTHDGSHIGGAPDRVYRLVLPAPREVSIELDPDGWDALLYVTGSPCGARAAVEACSDDAVGSAEEIDLELDAGTWYIVVDGFGEETFDGLSWGSYSLDVKVYDEACDD